MDENPLRHLEDEQSIYQRAMCQRLTVFTWTGSAGMDALYKQRSDWFSSLSNATSSINSFTCWYHPSANAYGCQHEKKAWRPGKNCEMALVFWHPDGRPCWRRMENQLKKTKHLSRIYPLTTPSSPSISNDVLGDPGCFFLMPRCPDGAQYPHPRTVILCDIPQFCWGFEGSKPLNQVLGRTYVP